MNTTKINKLINNLSEKQRRLFLIDSFGAFLTAFFLFVVIRNLDRYFGMPKDVLTYLSVTASLLCMYSITCYLSLKQNWTIFMRIIGVANLLYCLLIFGLLIKYFSFLTILGTTYFLLEIIIIAFLGLVELKAATAIKNIR
ncbi:hypothetical protein D3C87_418170 [compost metagenome]